MAIRAITPSFHQFMLARMEWPHMACRAGIFEDLHLTTQFICASLQRPESGEGRKDWPCKESPAESAFNAMHSIRSNSLPHDSAIINSFPLLCFLEILLLHYLSLRSWRGISRVVIPFETPTLLFILLWSIQTRPRISTPLPSTHSPANLQLGHIPR